MNKTLFCIMMALIAGSCILAAIGRDRFNEARLSELRRQIHEQEIDNDNLRYQLKQCKMLYQGL